MKVVNEEMSTMYGYGVMGPMASTMAGWVLVTVLLLGLTVWLIVRYAGPSETVERTASARRILAERYARGELETEEYTHRLAELR